MANSDKQWGGAEFATAAICGIAGAIGALLGVISGASQGGSVVGKVIIALMQGVGGAVLFGLGALIAVTVGSAFWGLVSAGAHRLFPRKPSGL